MSSPWGERLATAGRTALAIVLALAFSELLLRAMNLPKKHDFEGSCDTTSAQPDARLGWVWRGPLARTVVYGQGGRAVDFAFDAHHDRVANLSVQEDPSRPTILLVGESIMAGHSLQWSESLPGLLEQATGDQVVTLGVDAYGSDQAFVRFIDAIPRFPRLVAVVTIVFPALLDRIAWDDRPRLSLDGDEARVGPPSVGFWHDLRLVRIADDLGDRRTAAVVALAAKIFRETARISREHGARPLFLTVSLPNDRSPGNEPLLDSLLTKQGLERVDPGFVVTTQPDDNHPDPASTRRIAGAVLAALGSR